MSSSPAERNDEPVLRPIQHDPSKTLSQYQSPLFSVLPPEVRDRIFAYALAPYPDPATRYAAATPYTRPSYAARPLQSTELLRTCRVVYAEAWFQPWTTSMHTFYLGHPARRPGHPTSTHVTLQPALETLHALHPDGPVELSNIQIFAQLYALEPGYDLEHILNLEHFHPKEITITIRHTDWWHWEEDVPLRIDGRWVGRCDSLWPSSVREVRLELESIERRRDQIDDVALQIAEQWGFRRCDSQVLAVEGHAKQHAENGSTESNEIVDADATHDDDKPKTPPGIVDHWTGSSTLNGARWLRDEPPNAPGHLNYYIRTLVFRPLPRAATIPTAVSAEGDYPGNPRAIETRVGAPLHSDPATAPSAFEEAEEIEAAGCNLSTPANEVRTTLEAWRRAQFEDARAAAEEMQARNLRNEVHAGVSALDRGLGAEGVVEAANEEAAAGPAAGRRIRPPRPGRGGPGRGRIAGGPPR